MSGSHNTTCRCRYRNHHCLTDASFMCHLSDRFALVLLFPSNTVSNIAVVAAAKAANAHDFIEVGCDCCCQELLVQLGHATANKHSQILPTQETKLLLRIEKMGFHPTFRSQVNCCDMQSFVTSRTTRRVTPSVRKVPFATEGMGVHHMPVYLMPRVRLLQSFPDGYNTGVGEGGFQLSGGQKQVFVVVERPFAVEHLSFPA